MKSTRDSVLKGLLLVAGILALVGPAMAQGRIRGVTTDTQGQPLKGVELSLICIDESIPTTRVLSDKKGKFVFGLVRPNGYRLVARMEGMRMRRVDANLAVPDDESLWAFEGDLDDGAVPPLFTMTGLSCVTYDIQLEQFPGDAGEWGTGLPISPTVKISTMIQENRLDEALAEIDRYLERAPEAPALHYLKAFALIAGGDFQGAMSAADKTLELDPAFEGVMLLRGRALEGQGKVEPAIEIYRAESESAQSVEVKRDSLLALAAAAEKLERFDDAVAALEKLIVVDPEHVDAHRELANLYLRTGEDEKARAMMDRVSALGVKDPAILYNLGAERFNASDFEAAADYFKKAIAARPDFTDAYLRLGYTQISLGDLEGAAQSIEKYLELSTEETDDVQTARAILEQISKP